MDPVQVGPYRILEKLGAGGMGAVYLGKHEQTLQVAAIKVLPASMSREEGFVERFGREIDAMQKLSHPHIVRLYESGVDDGTYYYAMEYVPGETMMGLLRREKRVPWTRAVDFGIQICYALKAAHDAGIIHRDLKPSNLLITPEGEVKLTDFGVAQVFAADRLTVTGGIIGTAEFMSPEQAAGKRATKQSDLYSLGAVLYCLVTGRPPFAGSTAIDVIQKHKFGQFDRPKSYVPELPSWLDDIICQLLEKDPAKRFPDAFVLARRLESVVRKVEVASEPETRVDGGDSYELASTSETVISEAGARMAGPGPGPATFMKEMVRAELADQNRLSRLGELLNHGWVLAGLLVVVIGLTTWLVWPRGAGDPEARFAAGVALMEQEAGPGWIEAREKYFEPLLAADREAWGERTEPYLQQIELYENSRALPGRLRRKKGEETSEPARLIRLAAQHRQLGEFDEADRLLSGLYTLLTADPEQKKMAEFVVRERESLERDRAAVRQQRDLAIADARKRARKLAATGQRAGARRVLEALLELYAGDRETERLRAEIRTELAALSAAGSPTDAAPTPVAGTALSEPRGRPAVVTGSAGE